MTRIGSLAARRNLAERVQCAADGEEIVITRHDQRCVVSSRPLGHRLAARAA